MPMTDVLRLKEQFIKVTDFRHDLSELRERFDKRMRDDPKMLPVEIVTEGGTPIAAVMPWLAWESIRELIFLMRAAENIEAGRVTTFPSGTSVKDALAKLRGRSTKPTPR
jgi:hypothetical protein